MNNTTLTPQTNRRSTYEVMVKPYSIKELCCIYTISYKTFSKWVQPFLNEIGPRVGNYYNVNQVAVIFHKLGMPGKIRE